MVNETGVDGSASICQADCYNLFRSRTTCSQVATMSDKQRTEHQETVNLAEDTIGAPNCPLPESDLEKAKPSDTVHDDQAVGVIAAYSGDARWTEEEEKRLVKKIDRRLLPILFLTYALQYYDKAMLSQAVSQTNIPQLA